MHLAAGVYHWQTGRFNLDIGNPPLTGLVSALPVLVAHPETNWNHVPNCYGVAVDFLAANGPRTCWLVTLGSWACIPFSLLGGYICFCWATDLYGDAAGMTALTLWCFSPNTLAYGQMITGDMPATATGVTAAYFFWRWLDQPTLGRAFPAGVAMGFAELAKMVWVTLYAVLPILWIFWFVASLKRCHATSFISQFFQLAVILLVCLYVLGLGYAFEGMFRPLDSYHVGRLLLEGASESEQGDQSLAMRSLARIPVPLPRDYVEGIDSIVELSERPPASYVRRNWRDGGHWYYYLYAVLVKLPTGLLALGGLALFLTLCPTCQTLDWRAEFLLLAMSGVVLGFVSASGMLQTFRYVLPFLPYVIVWVSKTGRLLVGGRRSFAVAASAFLSWSILSGIYAYPHNLSYFNELAGGPVKGHAHLIGADADFGQDFLFLKRWLEQHPETSPLGLTWRHPLIEPRELGIEYIDVPSGLAYGRTYSQAQQYALGPQPGWYAVNVNALRGRSGGYAYFFCFKPVGHAGYSIAIYHITREDANRVRKDLGLPPLLAESEFQR